MLSNSSVMLEPASETNADLLVRWTLDPVAQGPFKRVPQEDAAALRRLFLHDSDRQYFLIRALPDDIGVGRFYWRAWRFTDDSKRIDWELNIFIAAPAKRGCGIGSAVQALAARHLLARPETRSVFAYTDRNNLAERRALQKAGFDETGPLPQPHYPLPFAESRWILYSTSGVP